MASEIPTEWVALGKYSGYVGAAIQAYGTYQTLFGPEAQQFDWAGCVLASEKRIIRDSDRKVFQKYRGDIMTVAQWWKECATVLMKHPISPQNMPVFDMEIKDGITSNLWTLKRAIEYLTKEAPGDYGTYGALITAYSLLFTVFAVKLSASFAAGISSGSTALSSAISTAIEDVMAWPGRYYVERSSHLTIEVEQEYSGGGGLLGLPGVKQNTGWYIVHDEANDAPVGCFEGQRFFHVYPNKTDLVKERFKNSEVAISALPKIVGEWEVLLKQAVEAENTIHFVPIESTTVVLPRA